MRSVDRCSSGRSVVYGLVAGKLRSPGTGDRRVSFDLVDFYHNESRLIGVDSMKFSPHDVSVIADELRQGFEANILKVPAVDAVPFENAVEAYERVASGTARSEAGAHLLLV